MRIGPSVRDFSRELGVLLRYARTKRVTDVVTMLRYWRSIRRDSRQIIASIDHDSIGQLRSRYKGISRAEYPWVRYLDIDPHIHREVFRAYHYGLPKVEPLRILDLGTGPGLFLLTCEFYGHDAVGVDIEDPLFAALANILEVNRLIWTITPSLENAPFAGRFDIVTAFQIAFDGTTDQALAGPWGVSDWREFLFRVARTIVKPGGRLIMTGVRACLPCSPFFCAKTTAMFQSLTNQVSRGYVRIDFTPDVLQRLTAGAPAAQS